MHRQLTAVECTDRQLSESKLQQRVVYRAKKYGWRTAHAGKGLLGNVWATPMAPGWPDLTCVKAGHYVIFIELKSEKGKLAPEQVEWLELLNKTGNFGIVIRPSDLRLKKVDEIFRVGAPLV